VNKASSKKLNDFRSSAAAGCEELNDMKKEAETKAIEEWLRTVDKPLATKKGGKKNAKK